MEGPERYLFTGKVKDSTDLYYYGARYYDPKLGRFLTRDPYTSLPDDRRVISTSAGAYTGPMNPQELNRYSYAENNPLKFNDPTGLCSECAEILYEPTHVKSSDSMDQWEYIDILRINILDYLNGYYYSDWSLDISGKYSHSGGSGYFSDVGGGGSNCYYVAVKKCVNKKTGDVTVTEIRDKCYYDTEEQKRICRNQASADRKLGETLPHDPDCTFEVEWDCVPVTPPAPEPCVGTSLICIYVGLAVFIVSMKREGKRMRTQTLLR